MVPGVMSPPCTDGGTPAVGPVVAGTEGTLDAASGGATQGSGGMERRHLGLRSRCAGPPANEYGRGQAQRHQEREGGRGAADHRSGMGNASQARGNYSTGHTEPDQADCGFHELC